MKTFLDFVKKYVNKMNFGVTVEQMAAEFGVSPAVVQGWIAYAQHQNNLWAEAHGVPIPDNELIAEWTMDHPVMNIIHTPFGDWEVPAKPLDVNSPISELKVGDLIAIFKSVSGK